MFPSKWGYLLGLQLNDILRTGRTDVRFEYTDTHEVFYRHSLYTSGYTYEGRVIGHHVGTDARDMFVRLSHYLTDRVLMNLSFDRQTYRLAADAQATIDTLGCDLTVFLSRDWEVRTAYRYEEMSNARDDENHVFQLRLIRRF